MFDFLFENTNEGTLNFYEAAERQDLPGATIEGGFGGYVSQILAGILAIAAILVFIYLIWGGIDWISAGGDKGKTEKARDKITQAVIGLVVLVSAVAIFTLLQNFLGIEILTFTSPPSNRITRPADSAGGNSVPTRNSGGNRR